MNIEQEIKNMMIEEDNAIFSDMDIILVTEIFRTILQFCDQDDISDFIGGRR